MNLDLVVDGLALSGGLDLQPLVEVSAAGAIFGFGRKARRPASLRTETAEAREARIRDAIAPLAEGRPEWRPADVDATASDRVGDQRMDEVVDIKRYRERKRVEGLWAAEIDRRLARESEIDALEDRIAAGTLEGIELRCNNEACDIAVRADGRKLTPDEARRFEYCLGCNCTIVEAL